jgi:hypothetical protein
MKLLGLTLLLLGAALLFGRPLGSPVDRARGAGL